MVNKLRGRTFVDGRLEISNSGVLASRSSYAMRIINKTGGSLSSGKACQIAGVDSTSGLAKVVIADASAVGTLPLVGVLSAALADDAEGDLVWMGLVTTALDTSGAAIGDPVYVSDTGGDLALSAGVVTDIVGVVASLATLGQVFIFPKQVA